MSKRLSTKRSNRLGTYITHEYAVLKQIFSYLGSKDLSAAAKVCREWKDVAYRLTLKRNAPICYWKDDHNDWLPFCLKRQPKIVLHFSTKYAIKNFKKEEFMDMLREAYDLSGVPIISLRNNSFITSYVTDGVVEAISKKGKNSEALLLLCDMPGVTLKCFHIKWNAVIGVDDECLNEVTNPKGLLIFSGGDDSCTALAYHVINSINMKCTNQLKMAGGITQRVLHSGPFSDAPSAKNGIVGISFHGENVEVEVGLHQLTQDIDEFMDDLGKKIGPLPDKCVRCAFMFTCVNRWRMFHEEETSVFLRHFPNVPVYGFWSYGEFALLEEEPSIDPPPEKRRRSYPCRQLTSCKECLYEECTSYFIVTFRSSQ